MTHFPISENNLITLYKPTLNRAANKVVSAVNVYLCCMILFSINWRSSWAVCECVMYVIVEGPETEDMAGSTKSFENGCRRTMRAVAMAAVEALRVRR